MIVLENMSDIIPGCRERTNFIFALNFSAKFPLTELLSLNLTLQVDGCNVQPVTYIIIPEKTMGVGG